MTKYHGSGQIWWFGKQNALTYISLAKSPK